jgi:hypothetical protein
MYTGVVLGQIIMLWFYSSWFDGTGRGVVGGDADGWALCNGLNGTPSLQDYWPVSGTPSGGGYVTNTYGQGNVQFGGARGPLTIAESNLPALHVKTWGVSSTQFTHDGTGFAWIGQSGDSSSHFIKNEPVEGPSDFPTGTNTPLSYPPFVALGFAMFIGYT